jgi:hypothetical protein
MAQVPQPVLDYLTSEKTVTLATATPDGVPHASTFMYVNDGPSIYLWARPSSTTAEHINRNSKVSFAIDEYVEDWNKAKGIQGDGDCQSVTDGEEIMRVVGMFADKFPSPSSGASTIGISFFRITPHTLQFIDNEGAKTTVSADEFGMDFHREQVLSE